MPKRSDIRTILVIGSGPIVIGQACEFDYSGTQACKVLREEGYRVILINSNPATIMTDSETADEVYIEPIDTETIEKILIKEKIDAILPTVGGQTALNVSLALKEAGLLDAHNVSLIGADETAIRKAENRELFEQAMHELGYRTTPSRHVKNMDEAIQVLAELDLPVVIRPSFTLGGSGGATVTTREDYLDLVENGLRLSRIGEVVVEQSIVGWKEFELEVMKDRLDNTVIICSIENIDPIGIHTGDSMTVAPQQTLSDREYQHLRDMTIQIIQKIGVDTGGANVQFAVNGETGDVIVIEMNPRVSRSSALASKATGFPIAKIAAKLAVGYTLDEIDNDITRSTPACFEPSIDYVVVKLPRFAFEKFSQASPYLGVQMKSVGEAMAIGRTFTEAFQKAIRSLESGIPGFDGKLFSYQNIGNLTKKELNTYIQQHRHQLPEIQVKVEQFHHERLCFIKDLFFLGLSEAAITRISLIDPWFIHQFATLFNIEQSYWKSDLTALLEQSSQKEPLPLASPQSSTPNQPLSEPFQANQPLSEPPQTNHPLSEPSQANQPQPEPSQANHPLSEPSQANQPLSEPSQANHPLSKPSQANHPLSKPSQANQPQPEPSQANQPQSKPFQANPAKYPSSAASVLQLLQAAPRTESIFSVVNGEHFLKTLKKCGFSDIQLAFIFTSSEEAIRRLRHQLGFRPVYKIVDTCAGEFEAQTPYYYSSYDEEDELHDRLYPIVTPHNANLHNANPHNAYQKSHPSENTPSNLHQSNDHSKTTSSTLNQTQYPNEITSSTLNQTQYPSEITSSTPNQAQYPSEITSSTPSQAQYPSDIDDSTLKHQERPRERIVIIGGGPNRIGQGIEFDYMCVQASLELRTLGYDAVMINSNPETVSTDYDVSSLLFFEPLTTEDTLEIIDAVKAMGVIVHFGGQTSLNLSEAFNQAEVKILGTQYTHIMMSEDRKAFRQILNELHALQPESEAVFTYPEVLEATNRIGYPVLIRPSFVLGGRAMKVAHNEVELKEFFTLAKNAAPPVSILVDKYLEGAREVDVDLLSDGVNVIICGILEHIEEAGIHSGDSACFIPPKSISEALLTKIIQQAKTLACRLNIIGLMNIQFALYEDNVYFLEANPRGSRTIPFVSKATGIPWVRMAIHVIMGHPLSAEDLKKDFSPKTMDYVAVKEAVLPFSKFPGEDPLLGPEMKSTGEVMGIGENLYEAFYKTQQSTHYSLPIHPCGILVSVHKKTDKLIETCQTLLQLGYTLYATAGTQQFLAKHPLTSTLVHKLTDNHGNIADNDIVSRIVQGQIKLVFNTPSGHEAEISDAYIRLIAQKYGIGVFTTLAAIHCVTQALKEHRTRGHFDIYSIRTIANRRLAHIQSLQSH